MFPKITILTATVLGLISTISVRAEEAKKEYPPITEKTKKNWDEHCTKCHGKDGKAKTRIARKLGAKDLTDPKIRKEFKDEKIFKGIKEGIREDGKKKMDAFKEKLTDKEIWELIAYVRKLGDKDSK